MSTLHKEVEKAAGPSRELSDKVLRALGWRTESHGFQNINGSTESVEIWLAPGQDFRREDFVWLADDAAMNMWADEDAFRPNITDDFKTIKSIIPPACVWEVKGTWDDLPGGSLTYFGECRRYLEEYVKTESKTPELALLSAILGVLKL